MKIALLGHGKEGQATKKYFQAKHPDATFDIFENETPEQIKQRDYSPYDIIFRSPSIPPLHLKNETTATRYFFDHCPCPIIGVTATKGKGTTCSFIKSLLDAERTANPKSPQPYLVGNIGTPAIEVLDELTENDVVIYEMSSFQLWDLEKSPHIAVLGQIEPDHLNVHSGMDDYLAAKSHITTHQTPSDFLIYYSKNPTTVQLAKKSKAQKIPYPFSVPQTIQNAVKIPGTHNLNNALAAIAAVASFKNISPDEYLSVSENTIIQGLSGFHGLPHRLEFVRELNGVYYYDDNFSTGTSSLKVAVDAFPGKRLVVIAGGRDKTDNQDLEEIYQILKSPQVSEMVFIGESGHEIAHRHWDDPCLFLEETLEDAVYRASGLAESYLGYSEAGGYEDGSFVVLMSPAAASFDMFKNVYDRGDQYKLLVENL